MIPPTIYFEEWDIVRTYNEFVDYIKTNGIPEVISFDHDLADEHYDPSMYESTKSYSEKSNFFKEKTGYDCVKWMGEYCIENSIPIPTCYVHSMNPVGRDNIKGVISNLKKLEEKGKI
jgi:hypothetical protein